MLEREVISAVKFEPSDWRKEVAGIGTIQLDLLKTGGLASLNRLEGALDAAEDCWNHGE